MLPPVGNRISVSRCKKGLDRAGCPFIMNKPNQVIKSVNSTGTVVSIKGKINWKARGGFLYLLWSPSICSPVVDIQELGWDKTDETLNRGWLMQYQSISKPPAARLQPYQHNIVIAEC